MAGGKSRKRGAVSYKLIEKIKREMPQVSQGGGCKPKTKSILNLIPKKEKKDD